MEITFVTSDINIKNKDVRYLNIYLLNILLKKALNMATHILARMNLHLSLP